LLNYLTKIDQIRPGTLVDATCGTDNGFKGGREMGKHTRDDLVTLGEDWPVWDRVFTVNPLVLIGTRERGGGYDLAPKHMAFPMGWENYFGFVCTPRHATYHNAGREGVFTVSYPKPTQVVLTSLAASPREVDGSKPSLYALPTFPASEVDGVFIEDAYLFLECVLDRIVDDFGENSLIAGRVVAAHVSKDYLRVSDRDENDLVHESHLLAYLSPGRYARVRDSNSFPFPANFMR
jgi:flavin reductase (DIM6/NTAB) family NADH-FMN oxidoreductase RutF